MSAKKSDGCGFLRGDIVLTGDQGMGVFIGMSWYDPGIAIVEEWYDGMMTRADYRVEHLQRAKEGGASK